MIEYFNTGDSQKKIDDVQLPVSCFLTFECEEGKCRADNYMDHATKDPEFEYMQYFLGHPIYINEAKEASDIIWENRSYSRKSRRRRAWFVFFIFTILLIGSFIFMYAIQKEMIILEEKYPA